MNTQFENDTQTATIEPPKAPNSQPRPKTAPAAPRHSAWDDQEAEVAAWKKWALPVIAGVLLAGGIGFVAQTMSKKGPTPPPEQETVKVEIFRQPPPPPVIPPPPQQMEDKKDDVVEEVKEPDAQPEPAAQVETALKGDGSGGMVLKSGNGSGVFNPGNSVSPERLRWKAYAGQVSNSITRALGSNPKTRKASMQIVVHVWLDSTGAITRATLDGSTSDAALDAAIRELLPGLQAPEPPPVGMPMPINMKITGRRPN